jgi:hypothetical protein
MPPTAPGTRIRQTGQQAGSPAAVSGTGTAVAHDNDESAMLAAGMTHFSKIDKAREPR